MPFRKHFHLSLKLTGAETLKIEHCVKCSPCILKGSPAEKAGEYLLSTVKHGGGSVIVLAALSWDSLALRITPHSAVMAEVCGAVLQDHCTAVALGAAVL